MIIGLQHICACTGTQNGEYALGCRLIEHKHKMKHLGNKQERRQILDCAVCSLSHEGHKKLKKLLSKMQSKMVKNRLSEAELKSRHWSTFIRIKWHK